MIGPCGAGKSTAARRLGELTGLPVVHLDQIYWQPGWVEPTPELFAARLDDALNRPRWIIDGNYGGTMQLRMDHADTLIYLDYPIPLCLWRLLRRLWTYHGRTRPDMTRNCPEELDLPFLWYIMRWPWTKRPVLKRLISAFPGKVLHFRHPRELKHWLESI